MGTAGATRDLAVYRQIAPDNIYLQGSTKTYVIGREFSPVFNYDVERVLSHLSHGFVQEKDGGAGLVSCEIPGSLSRPRVDIVAALSRAINMQKPVQVRYCSISSGWGERELIPHSLVDSGQRWHVRSFDRKSQEFRDFVITRIDSAEVLEGGPPLTKHERMQADNQWTRIVELVLKPHPAVLRTEIIERDYGMTNGMLKVELRAALAGYFLRQWQVDCSPNCDLGDEGFQLCLDNPLALYGVKNLKLAPGYKPVADSSTDRGISHE
ncbi:MAG: WYL domain-containing protein [Candidatus Obscuribacterales bacterium]